MRGPMYSLLVLPCAFAWGVPPAIVAPRAPPAQSTPASLFRGDALVVPLTAEAVEAAPAAPGMATREVYGVSAAFVLASVVASGAAWVSRRLRAVSAGETELSARLTPSVFVVDPARTPEAQMAVAAPEAPARAGFVPDVDLGDQLPACPDTKWDAAGIDVREWQSKYQSEELPVCPLEVHATSEANAAGPAYFRERREEIMAQLAKHGTVWLRGFDLTKDPEGFHAFWEALDLPPCLDPIHSSGLRKFLSKNDAVYEEVNKQNLSQHYIGLHQEMTERKCATNGAFVCFKPATESGGEFLIADGERIFRDMDPDTLQTLVDRQVRISVSNLDLDVLGKLPSTTKDDAMEWVRQQVGDKVAPKFDMDLEMLWGTDGKPMRLQAIEMPQSPVNRHPVTKRPVWFCNMHNHARFLRERRPCNVPEVGMTDVFFGNLDEVPGELLQKVNEACEKNIVHVPMQPGDVLLIDNYKCLHGRDIFVGDRLHAVSWFGDDSSGPVAVNRNDGIAGFVNKFVVGD